MLTRTAFSIHTNSPSTAPSAANYDRGPDRDKTTDPAYLVRTTLASLLLLKLGHSHGNRQLLCQCFGNVRRHDELHRDGFWSQLRDRDRSSKDHAPVQRMS